VLETRIQHYAPKTGLSPVNRKQRKPTIHLPKTRAYTSSLGLGKLRPSSYSILEIIIVRSSPCDTKYRSFRQARMSRTLCLVMHSHAQTQVTTLCSRNFPSPPSNFPFSRSCPLRHVPSNPLKQGFASVCIYLHPLFLFRFSRLSSPFCTATDILSIESSSLSSQSSSLLNQQARHPR
jgi:hypothetical protein